MKYYLGFGSNLGDRKLHLESALARLNQRLSLDSLRVSPVYETPALLPDLAPAEWNKAFLNLVCEFDCDEMPEQVLKLTQQLEQESGRVRTSKWSPRELDVDVLLVGDLKFNSDSLTIPHPEIKNRPFVLDPLKDLNPCLKFPNGECVLDLARRRHDRSPVWMAIVNLTPDSFSDGGRFSAHRGVGTTPGCVNLETELDSLVDSGVGIIDIGGESTRPGAGPVAPEQEWHRLKPALEYLQQKTQKKFIRPLISVDSRHYATAVHALEFGVDIINDVSGLADERYIDLVRSSRCQYVLMHSLSVPTDPKQVLPEKMDVMSELNQWFSKKIQLLESRGVQKQQIVIDPGVGFGKTAIQSQTIVKNIEQLYDLGCRVLVGHSRKSFFSALNNSRAEDRDLESIGMSLSLVEKGVDILRVHNPAAHMRAFQGWSYGHT